MDYSNNTTLPASHYVMVNGKKIHYIDEGKGETILFVHGIPEWSMLYASVVRELSSQYRCIVPDHLGFGLSDRDSTAVLTPEAHAQRLIDFIKELQLSNIHLVVHDLGGPIGLGALVSEPSLFRTVTITNTFLWSLNGTPAGKALAMMNGRIGKWLYLNYGFSVKFMAKNAFADKACFDKYRDLFMQVHKDKDDRYANYVLMLEMLRSSSYYDSTLAQLHILDTPRQIIWGMKDKFFSEGEYLSRWQREFPQMKVTKLKDSGHFPQMEVPKEYADAIRAAIAASQVTA